MAKKKYRKPVTEHIRSFQTRPGMDDKDIADTNEFSTSYNKAKRATYVAARKAGTGFGDCKASICEKFNLPARIANSIAIDLKGMVKSINEKAKLDLIETTLRLEDIVHAAAKLRTKLKEQGDKGGISKRKLNDILSQAIRKEEKAKRLAAKIERLKGLVDNPYPPICFGSRKLFNVQHHLKANKYADHIEWRNDFQDVRSSQFMVVGSADEADGNKTCRAEVNEDGSVDMTLAVTAGRNPETIVFHNVRLPYGHEEWLAALAAAGAEHRVSLRWQSETAALVRAMKESGKWTEAAEKKLRKERFAKRKAQAKEGTAISYRFVRDGYGWRTFVSVATAARKLDADFARGSISVDLNDGFLAVVIVDRFGIFQSYHRIPIEMDGKTTGQRNAILHDAATYLCIMAEHLGLPICIETLDFSAKKLRLKEMCPAAARRLSSFAYNKFAVILKAHARLKDIVVVDVEPAYTSIIGAVCHAVPLGLTVHAAAAVSIARRAMGLEETIPDAFRLPTGRKKARAIGRPAVLRSKAPVDPWWSGWKEMAKAVHEARATAKEERWSGSQRRKAKRDKRELDAASEIPY